MLRLSPGDWQRCLGHFLVWTILVGAGCATQQIVELEPMRFEAVRVGDKLHVEDLDPKALFRQGGAAYQKKDFETAHRKFQLLTQHFPDSRYALVADYNAGLALIGLKRFEPALAHFERTVKATTGSKDAHDALFQLGTCFEALERWKEAVTVFDRILVPEFADMVIPDRIEAFSRRGYAREQMAERALAERDYLRVLRLYRENVSNRALYRNKHVSLAQFRIGELYTNLFRVISFRLPLERMDRDLEDKSNYFLKAQSAYLRTLRLRHPEYSVMAGHRLGFIFERFYDDLLSAEVPDDLTREEITVYFEELRDKIRPLLTQAIDIYERNLRLGERMGQRQSAWFRKSEARLARLKEVLRQNATIDAHTRLRDAIAPKGSDAGTTPPPSR